MKIKLLSFLFLLTISSNINSQTNNNLIKILLEKLSRDQFVYLSRGDVDKYLELFSTDYTDLGGGLNGDGSINTDQWRTDLNDFFRSEEADEILGKKPDEILDMKNRITMNYSEILKKMGDISRFSFILRKGDYLIKYPPLKGALLIDGWYGIFRLENDKWKIVAGD